MTAIPEQLTTALADRYRLDRELGAGGMATVYQAHDLRHDRRVAVKVLHPELSAVLGGERFLSEIKTTAALQHPHILPLFDSGSAGGLLFYVMPLVDGETLRTRLLREKQLPVGDAIRLATQVAGALDYAHRHGVIHRDIKPENILLHEGSALVADFGISLAVQQAGGQRMTQTGLSLGTPQYMSPEQAMGEREITARSDLYALGVMTYEMLTGDPPFTGSSTQAIVARVLTEEPRPIAPQRKNVPEHVEAAVLTAIEKLPADRFATVAEYAAALASETGAVQRSTAVRRSAIRSPARGPREAILIGAALLLAAVAAWGWLRPGTGPEAPVIRYAVTLPRATVPQFGSRLALSPDGSLLVFVGPRADSAPGRQLWQRARHTLDATPIQGTEGASNPAFSPDGTRLAFLSGDSPATLKVVSIAGGLPIDLARGQMGVAGLSWGSDGWLYVDGLGGSLFRVPESGGTPAVAVGPDTTAGIIEVNTPAALPNGKGVLVRTVVAAEPRSWMVSVLDLKTLTLRPLLPGVAGRFLSSGHLLIIGADGTLGMVPFDADRLEVSGDVVNLGRGVHVTGWQVNIAVGRDAFAYARGSSARDSVELVWLGLDGRTSPAVPGWIDAIEQVALAPDGSRLAAVIRDQTGIRRVWIRELGTGAMNRLSMGEDPAAFPSFSRDGRMVYYARTGSARQALMMRPSDGSRGETLLAWAPVAMRYGIEAPGGELVIEVYDNARFGDLMTVRPGQDTVARPLRATGVEEGDGVVSPDGRWLAYYASEGGGQHVYVRPYPNLDETVWQVSRDNGVAPGWSRDGRELYFETIEGNLEAVEVLPGPTFTMGRRRTVAALGDLRLDLTAGIQARDGRLLARRRVSSAPDLQIVVVQNFAAELRARRR